MYGENSYQLGTLSIENSFQISFDSKNLISKIKLEPKDSLMIGIERGTKPKFLILKKIVVFSNDTLVLKNKSEMLNSFVETQDQLFLLNIR